jgi:hypothetical protein
LHGRSVEIAGRRGLAAAINVPSIVLKARPVTYFDWTLALDM